MRLCVLTRLFAAAGTVALAAGSTPTYGQTPQATITATVAAAKTAGNSAPAKTTNIQLGVDKTYTLEIVNKGPSPITAITIDATFTPPAAPYDQITVTPPAGCVKTGTTDFPCKLDLASTLLPDISATPTPVAVAEIVVNVAAPNPLPTATADCPGAGTIVHDVVSVTNVWYQTDDATVAPVTATSLDKTIVPYADLSVEDLTAPGSANQGETIAYSSTLHNYGPCDATGTFSDFYPPGSLTLASASGCVNNATIDADGGCDLSGSTFAVGSNVTYTSNWTVANFPKSATGAAIDTSNDVVWDHDVINGPNPNKPAHSNAGSTRTIVNLTGSHGCDTGGAGTLAGLLSLLALRIRRRRAS